MNSAETLSKAEKTARLRELLKSYGRLLVAFSGGKDSFFLLQTAMAALGAENVFAYFVKTPYTLQAARERVAYFQNKFSLPLREISIDFLRDAKMRKNPRRRCFLCKMKMFTALKKEARQLAVNTIADGTNASDLNEHRPGRLALEKLGIQSPLKDAGFTTAEIVAALKKQGVEEYFLTSSTCLATRFPYDFNLSAGQIHAIGRIEHHLIRHGIYPLRVRHMTDGVRIETVAANFQKLIALKDELIALGNTLNLRFVTLDLAGLKSGSWDSAVHQAGGRK